MLPCQELDDPIAADQQFRQLAAVKKSRSSIGAQFHSLGHATHAARIRVNFRRFTLSSPMARQFFQGLWRSPARLPTNFPQFGSGVKANNSLAAYLPRAHSIRNDALSSATATIADHPLRRPRKSKVAQPCPPRFVILEGRIIDDHNIDICDWCARAEGAR